MVVRGCNRHSLLSVHTPSSKYVMSVKGKRIGADGVNKSQPHILLGYVVHPIKPH